MMEPEKAKFDEYSVHGRKNKINAQAWKRLFKRQRIEEIVPDADGELEGPYTLSQVSDEDSRGLGSDIFGECDDVNLEFGRTVVGFDGALQKSMNSLDDSGIKLIPVIVKVVNDLTKSPCGNGLKDCINDTDALKSEVKGTTIPSDKDENHSIHGTSILCSIEKRVGLDSLEQKLPSCGGWVLEDIGGSSASEEIHLQGKAVGSEIENKIKKIQKKCNKRMKKLIQKQQEEIQMFYQIWEEKGEELKADHILKSAVIQTIHGKDLVKMDKLKLLNDSFAKTMEEHNLLKDTELKSLEAKQLIATNAERQKAALLLDEVKAFTSELEFVDGVNSFGSQSEDVASCSQSSTLITISSPVDVVPTSRQSTEDLSSSKGTCMHGNDIVPSVTSISAPARTVCCSSPVEAQNNFASFNFRSEKWVSSLEFERLSLTVAEHPNPVELSCHIDEIVSADSLASGQKVCGGLELIEMNREVKEEVSGSVPTEVSEQVTPLELSDASEKEYDNGDTAGLNNSLENMRNEPNDAIIGNLPFPEKKAVPEEQIPQSLVSDVRQLENQNTLPIGVSTLESVDTVAPAQLNHASQEAENCEQLYPVSVEAAETEVFVLKPVSETGENLEHNNHPDQDPPPSSIGELSNQAVLHIGIEADTLQGSCRLLASLTPQVTTWNTNPYFLSEPLQNELERINKETKQLEKCHEDATLQMKFDCEKKIEESITQIRNEYEVKIKNAEEAFALKKNELDNNRNMVLMNKMLAEAFRSKCLDMRPAGLLDLQQDNSPSILPHLHSASSLQSSTAAMQVTQAPLQLSSSQSQRLSPVEGQNIVAPVRRTGALFSCTTPSRPLVISAITPSGNPCAGGDIRTTAPHLQPFISVPTSSTPFPNSSSMPRYLSKNTPPIQPLPPPSVQKQPSTLLSLNLHMSSLDLPANVNTRPPRVCAIHTSPPVHKAVSVSSAVETDIVCLSDDD